MRMLAAPATGALDSRGYWVPAGFFSDVELTTRPCKAYQGTTSVRELSLSTRPGSPELSAEEFGFR